MSQNLYSCLFGVIVANISAAPSQHTLLYSPAFQQELLRPSLGRGSDLGRKVLVKLVFNFNVWMTRVPLFSPDAPDRVGGDGGDGGAPVGTKAWGHLKFSNRLILCLN